MLEYMRKAATSFFAKILLGGIALLFVLYFGFSGGGGFPQGANAPIAKVNGENIPYGLLLQSTPPNVPKEFRKTFELQELQRLIGRTLLTQAAQDVGIRISDEELRQTVFDDANFQEEGQFNLRLYKNYQQIYIEQTGAEYETMLRDNLSLQRFQNSLEDADIVSEKSVADELKVKQNQVKVKLIQIPVSTDEKSLKLEEAQTLAQQWIQATQQKQDTAEILAAQQLQEIEIGPRAITALQRSFGGGEASVKPYQCLLALKPNETCTQSFPIENKIIAFQLLERSQSEITDEDRQAAETQFKDFNNFQIIDGVANLLLKRAKVVNYLREAP